MKQDLATIIRLTKLTDTSLIVSWISENHGLIKTVAKGARRPKSPFAGKLDLFFSAELCWNHSQSSELHTLREVQPSNYREELRSSYINTEIAAYFVSLMESTAEPNIPADGYHDLLTRGLDYLCSNKASTKALLHFESELTKLLGIHSKPEMAASNLLKALGSLPHSRNRCLNLLDPAG